MTMTWKEADQAYAQEVCGMDRQVPFQAMLGVAAY